jgi:hypothetical protein
MSDPELVQNQTFQMDKLPDPGYGFDSLVLSLLPFVTGPCFGFRVSDFEFQAWDAAALARPW